MVDPHPKEGSLRDVGQFLVRVGLEAHEYGASSPRVGDYLSRLARVFNLRGGFLTWPHHMLFVMSDEEHHRQQVDVERLPPAGFALAKLAGVGDVVDAVERGDLSPAQAQHSLDDIAGAPAPWGAGVVGLSYAVIGLGIAALLQGSWLDAVLGAGLAVVVYAMVLAAAHRSSRWAPWLPMVTAFVPAAVATSVRNWYPEVDVLIVTIAAIAILLPGYAVSIGIGELVEDHVIAGWTNLVRGLVYLAKQVLGAWLGVAAVASIVELPPAPAAVAVADAWLWLLMPLLIIGICVVFQTSQRDFWWATISCAVAFATSLVGDLWNANLGTLAGAAIAAIYANLWASRTRRPTSIVLLPAIVILVSGSVGFQGLAALAEGETNTGTQQFVQMFVVAVMISAGLLVGNTIARPRTTL